MRLARAPLEKSSAAQLDDFPQAIQGAISFEIFDREGAKLGTFISIAGKVDLLS